MLLFYKIQVAELTNSSFGFGCKNVCTRALLFAYLSFWGWHEGLGSE
jgi:hypothetical protein